MPSYPCWNKFKGTDLHELLKKRTQFDDPSTPEGKEAYLKAAKDLQNENLNKVQDVYNKIGVKGYEKPIEQQKVEQPTTESNQSVASEETIPTETGVNKIEQKSEKEVNLPTNEGQPENIPSKENKGVSNRPQTSIEESPEKREQKISERLKNIHTEEITDPYDKVLSHFANGGKIHPSAVNELFGGAGKTVESQRRSMIGLMDNKGQTIDKLAHSLWEQDKTGKYDTQDYKDAIEKVLGSYNSPSQMAKDLVERYDWETAQEKYYNQEHGKEAIDAVENMSEDEINHLLSLDAGENKDKETEDYFDSISKPKSQLTKVTEEPTEGEGSKVGVHHAALTDLAKELGLPEPERSEHITPQEHAERGRQFMNAGAKVDEIDNKNNELHDRISIGRAYLEKYYNELNGLRKSKGVGSQEYKDKLSDINTLSEKIKKLGSKAGQSMTSLQGERDIDTDNFEVVKRNLEEAQDKPASTEQQKKISELTNDNEVLRKRAEDAEAKLIEQTDKNIGGNKSTTSKTKKTHNDYVKERKDSFQAARDALKKIRTGQSGLGVSVPLARELAAVAPHIGKIVKSFIEEGIDKLDDIVDAIHGELSKDMVGLRRRDVLDLVSGEYSEKPKPTDKDKYSDIKRQSILTKKLQDLQNGLPEDFDKNIKEQSPEVKKLLEQIKKVKKDLADIGYMKNKPDFHKEPLSAEEKNIKRLQKELDNLKEGNAKQLSPKRELSDKEKELQEQIKDEREKMGLVSSKSQKPITEEEQKESDKNELEILQRKFVGKSSKDNKFTIDESKDIWDYAKKNYLDKDVSYRDMISNVSNDLGLSWKQVSEAITSPKIKPISDEMWKKQSDYRRNQTATKNWIEGQTTNPALKVLKKVSGVFRGISVFGHGGIFVGTHAGMTLFQPTTWKHTIPAFFRGWKFAYGNTGNYERAMQQLKNSPNYVLAQRAGLKNNPERLNAEEYQKSQKYLGKLGLAGERGFNAIKVLRQDLFDFHYNKLSNGAKTPESAVSIAKLVNNATGATNLKIPDWVNEVTFAGGMEAARWGKLTRNPVKATTTALKALFAPESVSTSDKVFAKVWARRVGEQLGTFAGLLAANAAIQNTLNPKNPVNVSNPNSPDFLKYKFGNLTLDPTSGMRSVMSFIYGVGKIPFENQKQLKGDTRMQAAGKATFGYGRGKLAPLYSTAADFYTQQDFLRNPLPFSPDKPTAGHHKLTWTEYGWEHAPLPIAEAANVMYQSAIDNGADKMQLNNVLNGIMSGAISGSTGFRVGEYNAEEKRHSSISEEDSNKPVFKFFTDKGLELPNTSHESTPIPDKATHTMKKLSDYPKEKQDEYDKLHNDNLETELNKVIKHGSVKVDSYGNISAHGKTVKLDELDKGQLAEILHKAQSDATEETKKKMFPK